MKQWIVILMAGLVLSLGATGCIESTDPVSGQETHQVDPNAAEKVERGVETGISILMALNVIWPGLIPAGLLAILAGALGAYRKVKPQLTAALNREDLYYSTTDAVVTAIEAFKETNPDDWEKLEVKLEKTLGPEAINVIRALRGLPSKT